MIGDAAKKKIEKLLEANAKLITEVCHLGYELRRQAQVIEDLKVAQDREQLLRDYTRYRETLEKYAIGPISWSGENHLLARNALNPANSELSSGNEPRR